MKFPSFVLAAAAGVFLASSTCAPSFSAPAVVPQQQQVSTAASYRISGPFSSGNLSVYLIHGSSAPGAAQYITLQEALQKKQVVVHETGDVNQLAIENKGTQLVFIQSGDIVKGGRQDRAVQFDMVLPAKSGKVPISSFCVEQGRWSPRGNEESGQFSSSSKQLVSKEMKLAAKTPRVIAMATAVPHPRAAGAGAGAPRIAMAPNAYGASGASAGLMAPPPAVSVSTAGSLTGPTANASNPAASPYGSYAMPSAPELQGNMWGNVAKVQGKLQAATKAKVKSDQSESSLQLTLENSEVKKKSDTHIRTLSSIVNGKSDVIGYAFAINGKVNSADVYSSNALFVKLWPKLLDATAIEAVAEESEKTVSSKAPPVDAVKECLLDAEKAKPTVATTSAHKQLLTQQKTQDNKKNVLFETQTGARADKARLWVHRNYVAK